MGVTNYQLSDEQKRELDRIADTFLHKIEAELANQQGILDPYVGRKIDHNKLTAMLWYIGDYISAC